MAAFIPLVAPLIGTLAPAVVSLISSLVTQHAQTAEATHGQGTGAVKFSDVFVAVMQDLVNTHAAGQLPELPDEATVKTIIQAVVTAMKITNVLGTPAAAPANPTIAAPAAVAGKTAANQQPSGIPLTLTKGQTVTITVV